jgi:hypothetical protein
MGERSENHGRPFSAVNRDKHKRLSRAAVDHLKKKNIRPEYIRFDVIEVIGEPGAGAPEIRQIENAFQLASPYKLWWYLVLMIVLFAQVRLLQIMNQFVQLCYITEIRRLFRFHRIDENLMQHFEVFFIMIHSGFNALREEIVGRNFAQFIGMLFLVHYPTGSLVLILSSLDLLHGFFDRADMLFHHPNAHFVVVDPAGNLAMRMNGYC